MNIDEILSKLKIAGIYSSENDYRIDESTVMIICKCKYCVKHPVITIRCKEDGLYDAKITDLEINGCPSETHMCDMTLDNAKDNVLMKMEKSLNALNEDLRLVAFSICSGIEPEGQEEE